MLQLFSSTLPPPIWYAIYGRNRFHLYRLQIAAKMGHSIGCAQTAIFTKNLKSVASKDAQS